MGKVLRLAAVLCGAVLFAATWRSDVAADTEADATASITEPITEAPLEPAPGSETEAKDPFAPYGVGPAEEAVPYEALSPEEQAVADRGRDATGWSAVHDAYGAAVVERSMRARAESAQHQLGIDALDTTGVIQ
jgi:hypothetical protein